MAQSWVSQVCWVLKRAPVVTVGIVDNTQPAVGSSEAGLLLASGPQLSSGPGAAVVAAAVRPAAGAAYLHAEQAAVACSEVVGLRESVDAGNHQVMLVSADLEFC